MNKKCNFNQRVRSFAEREAGCPLDHCECGTHDTANEQHECVIDEYEPDIHEAELRAGWDSNP